MIENKLHKYDPSTTYEQPKLERKVRFQVRNENHIPNHEFQISNLKLLKRNKNIFRKIIKWKIKVDMIG